MMTTEAMHTVQINDAELVAESLHGNRDAFRQIVERYQTLISSLAYCATGDVSRSEDLAQETFVSAWKQLAELRDPAKLRPWLCSIARFLISKEFRRQGREPGHAAESLEAVDEWVSPEPLPPDQVISDEEKAILWRSLERIPEIYREPLVLFYREHQSIEAVAQDLGLSEDAVKQRLSRGRKLLQEQFLAFVAGALKQTTPGKAFTLGVIAALPLLATTVKAATVGTALAQHGSAAAKTTSLGGFLQTSANVLLGFAYWLVPVLPLGGYIGYKMGGDRQHSERARRSVASFWRMVGASMLLFVILPLPVLALIQKILNLPGARLKPFGLIWADFLIPVFVYAVAPLSLVIWVWRRRSIAPETAGGAQVSSQAGKSITLWVVLAMTGALVCLALFFWLASVNSPIRVPEARHLSTTEVQNLIANSQEGDIGFHLYQLRNGFRYLSGGVQENGVWSPLDAPAENGTLALLAEKRIRYDTLIENRDFTRGLRAVLGSLGSWAWHLFMPAFCFFIVVAGAVTLLRRRGHPPSVPRPIAAPTNERRVDRAFATLAACGMVAVAILLGLTTDWKVRRVAADQVPDIITQHKNARFEVFEYRDGSRKLWISDLRSPDFIAPADELTLGLLTRQGITYQTRMAGIDWWHRHPSMLGTSSAQPHPSSSGRPGLSQSTSVLGILALAGVAGTVLWWALKKPELISETAEARA
ncbi:MAG: sigma-70 family RNA polymerase sigma factor [Verrucomicrobia bacterium]|nr:sigma-70 family RNA polymerase sigma factor [Verrucomicrobiota bacterium]